MEMFEKLFLLVETSLKFIIIIILAQSAQKTMMIKKEQTTGLFEIRCIGLKITGPNP